MKYEFEAYQMEVENHIFWVAKSKFLNGCLGQGDTLNEAVSELEANENEWLSSAKEYNIPIPERTARRQSIYSGKVSLRFSPLMHAEAAENAKQMNISLNQYINDAIAYYNGLVKQHSFKHILDSEGSETTTKIINIKNFKKQKFSINIKEIPEEM